MKLDTATRKALARPETRRAAVKYQLDLQGLTMADVARDAGVPRQSLYQVFSIGYPRIERRLAECFGMSAQELFPERYRNDGSRIKRKPGPKPKKSSTKHIKNGRRRNVDGGRDSGHQKAA